jgi:hypothetical protein
VRADFAFLELCQNARRFGDQLTIVGKLDRANAGSGRFDKRREHERVLQ